MMGRHKLYPRPGRWTFGIAEGALPSVGIGYGYLVGLLPSEVCWCPDSCLVLRPGACAPPRRFLNDVLVEAWVYAGHSWLGRLVLLGR